MRTLKILGFLLTYPEACHTQALDECAQLLSAEKWLSDKVLKNVQKSINALRERELLDLQEDYVALFDRTPSLSLHLFEHIHGDSRDRGQALADLLKVYENAGLYVQTEETPDYLPLFLEYLSTLPPNEASETLSSVVNILSSLAQRLHNRGSLYASILEAAAEAASRSPDAKSVEDFLRKSSGDVLSAEQVDREWEEQFAFENTPQTTGQNSGCPKAEEMLARMNS